VRKCHHLLQLFLAAIQAILNAFVEFTANAVRSRAKADRIETEVFGHPPPIFNLHPPIITIISFNYHAAFGR
jgi:hypothetical protein